MSDLSEIRKEKKARKPAFVSQDSWKRRLLPRKSWRRPRGLHSKMRLKKRGNPKSPSHGYRSPKAMRALTPFGTQAVVVSSVKGLAIASGKDVIISSTVGNRKKLEIIKAASEKKLAVLNLNVAEFAGKIAAEMEERKKRKSSRKQKDAEPAKKPVEPAKKDAAKPQPSTDGAAGKKPVPESKKSGEEEQDVEKEKRKKAIRESEKIITKRN